MRILGAAVLAMESLVMGFALLIAMKDQSATALVVGSVIAIALLFSASLLKRKSGWIIASILQVVMLAYALIVPALIWIGIVFLALWVLAIVVGRKGEAIRRELMENPPKKSE
ncbi:MAG: hypothetical protein RL301_96 [Actinomycetota bacterium]